MTDTSIYDSTSVFKPECLKGRVVLCTGGGSGIGFGICMRLARHGCKVVVMGRRKQFLDDAVKTLREHAGAANSSQVHAEGIVGDVRKEEDGIRAVKFTLEKFGKLDTLVNCAAGNFLALAEDLSVSAFKNIIEIDTVGVYMMSKAAMKPLHESGQGVVINISATLHYNAAWYQVHASAAKAAIDSITKQLALEWGAYGCRVAGIAPGPIEGTPGLMKLSGNPDAMKQLKSRIPLGRPGTTKEIGDTAVFLCSDAGAFITGHTLVVDGGEWLWTPPQLPRDQVQAISRGVEKKSRELKSTL